MNLPPYCFCIKPAVRVQTEDVGLVYECHYTQLDLWRIRPNEHWHSESHGPSPNPSTSTSLCGTTPSSSPPQSPSIPHSEPRSRSDDISASMDSSPCSLDMDRVRPDIQDIVQSLNALAITTKNDLPKPCNDHQPGPTLAHPFHPYTSHIGNNKISNNNNTIGHRSAGQNNNSLRLKRPKAICGFHLHAKDMEMFRLHLWKPETSRKGTLFGSRARSHWEAIFARCHHEIVLKHPQLHPMFLNTAQYSGCEANLITVGRWVNQYLDGKRAPLGSAPKCFCGLYMVLSWYFIGATKKIGYTCALRLKDSMFGCARVLWSEESLYRQPPFPIHPLASENKFLESGPIETCDSRGEGGWKDVEWDKLDIPNIAAGSSNEAKSRNTGVVSDVETIERTQEQHRDVHHANDDSAQLKSSADPKIIEKPFNLNPLPLPTGLVNIDNRIERIQSRKENHLAHSSAHSNIDDLRNRRFVESQPLETSSKKTRQRVSLQLVNSPSGGPDWFAYLSNRSDQVFRILAPKQMMLETSLQTLENLIETWQGSVGRLKDFAATLRLNGYDNPTLACRLCKQGLPLRANLPCFHLVMCDDCIKTYGSCVICNKPIESSQRIYWG